MAGFRLHLAYYADDFTGATDALESLTLAGLRTRLFLEPPTPRQLAAHPGLQAIGVAGLSRSLSTPALARTLRPAFTALRRLQPRHLHYKICSTFDSSPRVGSIGRAIEIGREVFGRRAVPLLVAAPALGRYGVFGNLYARYGIGSEGAIHRLDRHPSVSRHPVTPMTEADLRRHLAGQTRLRCGLFDILDLERSDAEARLRLRELARESAVVLFDALRPSHVERIGQLLRELAPGTSPMFSVGSSGLGTALCGAAPFRAKAPPGPGRLPRQGRDSAPLLVLSGSCSPVTGGQIDFASNRGFVGVVYNPTREGREETSEARIIKVLREGRNVIAYTARGSARRGLIDPRILGAALGRLGRAVLARTNVRRLVVAGGDTSSYAARALGITSLEFTAPFVPGAPLCRATGAGSPIDGLEVNFKGGQVGAPDYFVEAAQ